MSIDDKWAKRYFELALHVAHWSKDPTTKVGAVIVGVDRRNVAVGYNGFPPGLHDAPELYDHRPTKYLRTQHAERNVLDNAHFSCDGGALATTMYPCTECAKSIISKGIKTLITPLPPEPLPNGEKSWRDDCAYSKEMLTEAGVSTIWMMGELPLDKP